MFHMTKAQDKEALEQTIQSDQVYFGKTMIVSKFGDNYSKDFIPCVI